MSDLQFFESLEKIIEQRLASAPEESYTAHLASKGVAKVAQKLGEEAVELALASAVESELRVREESADLVYHLILLLKLRGLSLRDVADELEQRHREKTASSTD